MYQSEQASVEIIDSFPGEGFLQDENPFSCFANNANVCLTTTWINLRYTKVYMVLAPLFYLFCEHSFMKA